MADSLLLGTHNAMKEVFFFQIFKPVRFIFTWSLDLLFDNRLLSKGCPLMLWCFNIAVRKNISKLPTTLIFSSLNIICFFQHYGQKNKNLCKGKTICEMSFYIQSLCQEFIQFVNAHHWDFIAFQYKGLHLHNHAL
jgi:hypothetical protein